MNFYNDIDQNSAAWLRELINLKIIPEGVVDTRSIHEIQPEELEPYDQCHFFAGIGGWAAAFTLSGFEHTIRIDSGSAPCQPFSSAGLKKGFDDKRHLWPELFRITKVRRPVVLVGEQVSGKDALEWLDRVFADLEGEGYTCGAVDICAAGTGAKGHPVCQESAEFYRALAERTDLSDELRGACAASAAAVAELTVGGPHIRSRLYWMAYLDGGRLIERDAGQRAVSELGKGSPACGLADPNIQRHHRIDPLLRRDQPRRLSEDDSQTPWSSPACGLADSHNDGSPEHEHQPGRCARRQQTQADPSERCCASAVEWKQVSFAADCLGGDDDEPGDECSICGLEYSNECACPGPTQDDYEYEERDGVLYARPVVQSDEQRLEGLSGHGDDGDQPGRVGAHPVGPVAPTGGPSNAWDDFDVIPCLDGKARRAERGTFPMVARLPEGVVSGSLDSLSWQEVCNTHEARKMRLFGYGNALCLPTACAFMDVLAEIFAENLRK